MSKYIFFYFFASVAACSIAEKKTPKAEVAVPPVPNLDSMGEQMDEVGSIDYYLSNNIMYASYANLGFALPEILEKMERDAQFKQHFGARLSAPVEGDESDTEPSDGLQLRFFLSQLAGTEDHDREKQFIREQSKSRLGLPHGKTPKASSLFEQMAVADGAGHWEVAEAILDMILIEGNETLSGAGKNAAAQSGYKDFLDKLDVYCFVAMADNNVPVPILERKRQYLLNKIDSKKYPAFYDRIKMIKITEID
jgi:hypothetical protein